MGRQADITHIAGTAISTGTGVADSGTPRVALSSDGVGVLAGAAVHLAISASSAELSADITAGLYEITATVDCYWDFTAAGGGGSVTWETAPAEILYAGERIVRRIAASARLAAICNTGVSGRLIVTPVS